MAGRPFLDPQLCNIRNPTSLPTANAVLSGALLLYRNDVEVHAALPHLNVVPLAVSHRQWGSVVNPGSHPPRVSPLSFHSQNCHKHFPVLPTKSSSECLRRETFMIVRQSMRRAVPLVYQKYYTNVYVYGALMRASFCVDERSWKQDCSMQMWISSAFKKHGSPKVLSLFVYQAVI